MKTLSPQDRERLMAFLSENASDQVLCVAALDTKKEMESLTNDFDSIRRYLGMKPYAEKAPAAAARPEEAPSEAAEPPSEPPGVACTKIGTDTKAMLLARAKKPTKPDELGRRYVPHFKLLWARGLLNWDGELYTAK